jgi:GTP cyclohydrolase II
MKSTARAQQPSLDAFVASTRLPTEHGTVAVHVHVDEWGKEHLAVAFGAVAGAKDLPVRVHSECFTGEVLGSLKCDCKQQLDGALAYFRDQGRGVLLYLRQEGRGIGLMNKIRAYALQELGHDTVEANHLLGLPDDARTYHAAATMLSRLSVRSIRLLTNNPDKIAKLRDLGISVKGRIPLVIEPQSEHAASYLECKRQRMGHLLDDRADLTLIE